jgi:PAS domain-containing protein
VHPTGATAAFAAVYLLTVLVGRVTRLEGSLPALVWPAAAVGFVWVATSWTDVPRRWANVGVLAVLAATATSLTGVPVVLAVGFGIANAVAATVSCAVMVRLQRRAGGSSWRLRHPVDLSALGVAAFAGSGAAALVGPVALTLQTGEPLLPLMGAWVLGNGTGTFVLTAVALRVAEGTTAGGARRYSVRGPAEVAGAALAITGAYLLVFGATGPLPLAFVVLPLTMWVALRFDTTTATLHVVLVGVLVVGTTLAGRGPFSMAAEASARVLLAQAFVAVVGLVTLVLALYRDERAVLLQQTGEQATLLRTVIDTTSDGISVFDATGRVLLRNPAAARFFADAQDDVLAGRDEHSGVFRLDGRRWPTEDLPLSHALRGVDVAGVDMLVRTPRAPDGRVISANAHPLPPAPGASWDGGAVMAFHDVTTARDAAAEIERSRLLVADLLDAATESAILGTDARGRITVFNVGAERMLGVVAADVLGQTPDRLVDPDELRQGRRPRRPGGRAGGAAGRRAHARRGAPGVDVPALRRTAGAGHADGHHDDRCRRGPGRVHGRRAGHHRRGRRAG